MKMINRRRLLRFTKGPGHTAAGASFFLSSGLNFGQNALNLQHIYHGVAPV